MGLFSNNKKPCPICGNPTPRLLATKVEGVPLCKDCADKIDLPDGALDQMSLEQLGKYMEFYEANTGLQSTFQETYRYGFGLLSGALLVDGEHRLLRLKPYNGALVLEAANLKSFRICEDSEPLFEGRVEGLLCHRSDVPRRAAALAPSIDSFLRQKQEFEHMENMHRMMERDHDCPNHDRPPRPPRPSFSCTPPVRKFRVELTLEHPYWRSFRQEIGGPDFSSQNPSVDDYLREYEDKVNGLHELAFQLAQIMNPGSSERWADEMQEQVQAQLNQAAAAVDTVAEIQKYKLLFDAGVLTEEEFAAKKKQLLGI